MGMCGPIYFFRVHVNLNGFSLTTVLGKFDFSVFMFRIPCTHTPSLPSGLSMPQGVCLLWLIFIPVLLCVWCRKTTFINLFMLVWCLV